MGGMSRRFPLALRLGILGCGAGGLARGTASGRTHQALRAKANEIGTPHFGQRLPDKIGILRAVILKQSALELLFVVIGHHMDRLHVHRIDPRIEHDRRGCAGGRVVVLHLLGSIVVPFQAKSQIDVPSVGLLTVYIFCMYVLSILL